jgi:hypothetical protein
MTRPTHFYKFCTAKVAKLNLATRRLRFSSPLRFNDPFDCYFPPGFCNLRQNVAAIEEHHHAILMGKEVLPEGSSAAFNMAPLMGLVGTVPPEVVERSRKSHKARLLAVAEEFNAGSQIEWEEALRRFRLLSLCAERNNLLLWAHYADCHRGVALEFEAISAGAVPFAAAMPMKYWKRVPRAYSRKDFIESALGLGPLPDEAKAVLPLVLTKSDKWTYEKEWRIVRMAPDQGASLFSDLEFSAGSLTRIFLGCRCTVRTLRAVERLAVGDLKHVEIYQARQARSRYALEFERVR